MPKANFSTFKAIVKSIINSYSQIFFSKSKFFAFLLILISFFDFFAGFCGIFGVFLTNYFAYTLGFDRERIKSGLYGFNSLLVCLGLGVYYEPSVSFFFILILASILTLFLSLIFEGFLTKYNLPFLSLPFLFSLWILIPALQQFGALGISQRGVYNLNDLYVIGGSRLVEFYTWANNLDFSLPLKTYFISLGAIFFQYNAISGIIIAIGLLYNSRIAFSLSLIGFFAAYTFYALIGANLNTLNYSYIGFNFVLTSIAIGGFFFYPTTRSYFWVVLLIPLVVILTTSFSYFLQSYQLSIYSLPFNIVVLLFLYTLKLRVKPSMGLIEVYNQQNSPEKNLYSYINTSKRFKYSNYLPIRLPFWGEWTVSQAHDGEYTHKGEWRHAWDFVITDASNSEFRNEGNSVDDYYCYNKAVLSPADGIVEMFIDHVEDNKIGDVNLVQNWGNTIIIKHANYLYSKLSHLKAGSIKVKIGDYVKAGETIAMCGNSGRSPMPHLHFQLQTTPFVGSKTFDYPICYYILNENDKKHFKNFDKPEINNRISNIEANGLLKSAFHLIPGQTFNIKIKNKTEELFEKWEVFTDIYNQSYIYSHQTGALAYFYSDGNLFYFINFAGNKNSALYYLYLAAHRLQYGFYENLSVNDELPVNMIFSKKQLFLQDFVAPFYLFYKSDFKLNYKSIDDCLSTSEIILKSSIYKKVFKRIIEVIYFEIAITKIGITSIKVKQKGKEFEIINVID